MKKILAVACLPILAACAAGSGGLTALPVQSNITNSAKKIDIMDEVVVRSFETDASLRKEFSGASCKIENEDFWAQFVTPARVQLPTYGTATKPAKITCSNGTKDVSANLIASNQTQADIEAARKTAMTTAGGVVPGGAIGRMVADSVSSGLVASRPTQGGDTFVYSDVNLDF